MGLGILRDDDSDSYRAPSGDSYAPINRGPLGARNTLPPNPNPERFEIEHAFEIGGFVCAMVIYPDCTTFEGRKIMVLEDTTEEEVRNAATLDPHFAEDGNIIARFRPDTQGWRDAAYFALHRSTMGIKEVPADQEPDNEEAEDGGN